MAACAALLAAASRAATDVETLETLAEVQALEQQKEQRVEKLKHSAAETMQVVKESLGDSAAETLIASHSHVSSSPDMRSKALPPACSDACMPACQLCHADSICNEFILKTHMAACCGRGIFHQ